MFLGACLAGGLVHDFNNLLTHSINRNIEISMDLQAEVPVILGDATQIQNALLNLGVNARDSMPNPP